MNAHRRGPTSSAAGALVAPPRPHRIPALDSLRFVAAFAVVFQHTIERQGEWGSRIAAHLSPGVFGVVLFFGISGFVIPMAAGARFDLQTFAIRRIFRIYPLILATFIVLAALAYGTDLPAFAYARVASRDDWIANLLLVQDYTGSPPLWGVTWTLSLEVAWYVLFAASLRFIGPRFDNVLVLAAPAVLLSLAAFSVAADHRLPLGRLGMIYAAILGCRAYRSQFGDLPLQRFLVDLGTFIVVVSICNGVSFGYFRHPNITLSQALYPWIAAPILLVAVTAIPAIRRSRVVGNRTLVRLGEISFSTYLLHPFAIGVAEMLAPSAIVPLVAVALTLGVSIAGYRLVEVPGRALGNALISANRRRTAATVSVAS